MKTYAAIANRSGNFSVVTIGPMGSFKPLGDCRSFDDYDEANQVARDIASGKYPWLADPGQYVNMR